MIERNKNIAIGIFTLTALGLLVMMLLFLHPKFGDEKNSIHARFTQINKVAVGTQVTFAGQPVGCVKKIEFTPNARSIVNDDIYTFELTLALDSKVQIYPCDEISLQTSGLMGEKSIAITPKSFQNKDLAPLSKDDVLYATTQHSLEETLQNITTITKKFEQTIDSIQSQINELKKPAIQTLENLNCASYELASLLKTANDQQLVVSINSAAKKLNNTLSALNSDKSTLGKLIYNDEIYHKGLSVLNGANTLMSDFNHYGPLYQFNSTWQKERLLRMKQLVAMQSSDDVKKFVSEELQKLTTISTRIELALEKANVELKNIPINERAKTYEALLKEIKVLEKNLEMYQMISVEETGQVTSLP